ncbi:hypothetical protein AB0H10_38140, partial [Streptomyces longwoodensis]
MTSAWADGIAANTLFVEDLAASKRFHLDVFDAPILFEDEQSVVFKFGATVINPLQTTHVPEYSDLAPYVERYHVGRDERFIQHARSR